MSKFKKFIKRASYYIDIKLFIPVLILLVIGIFAVMDVSAPEAMHTFSDRFYFVKQQLLWLSAGFVGFLIISQINIRLWEKYALPVFAIAIIFLFLVLIPQFGIKVLGARRWLNFGILRFQPSEFAKLALCIYLAKILSVKKNIIAFLIPVGLTLGLIMLQPDLGTSVVIGIIAFSQLFISGINLYKIFIVFAAGLILTGTLIFTSDYRKERVTSFLNPFASENTATYHIRQVIYSLAIGGVNGIGIGQSKQKYLFLPEATTDSIFAIISEETGFIGTLVIISLYFYISLRMLISIKNVNNNFIKILSVGIFAWFTGQTFVNLGSISSLIPFTGVPLPLISYGGSTLISFLLAFGIFNSCLKYSNKYE